MLNFKTDTTNKNITNIFDSSNESIILGTIEKEKSRKWLLKIEGLDTHVLTSLTSSKKTAIDLLQKVDIDDQITHLQLNQILSDTTKKEYFTNTKSENKKHIIDSLDLVVLGSVETTAINLSLIELLENAVKLSGLSIEQIIIEGLETYSQKLITQYSKPDTEKGKGSVGLRDKDIIEGIKKALPLLETKELTLSSIVTKFVNALDENGLPITLGLPTLQGFTKRYNVFDIFYFNDENGKVKSKKIGKIDLGLLVSRIPQLKR
jgi:hypothetical protein